MIFNHTIPTPEQYDQLRIRSQMSGGTKNIENIKKALSNSLFVVSLWEKDELIGFGRVVGDGGLTYVVSDIMVNADHQAKGYGNIIMQEINSYFEKHTDSDAYITLTAVKPADKLYSKFYFEQSEPLSCGMIRKKPPQS
ncbi:MAG: GNAT family N-acetyltransferase [Brevinema sp.]